MMHFFYHALAFLMLVHLAGVSATAFVDIVETSTGPLIGTFVYYDGKVVPAFLGVPFAEPPVGDLRFRRPVPKKRWTEPLKAAKLPPACLQHSEPNYPFIDTMPNKGEDCLYLNIWVPPNTRPSAKKAVMFWIYSGAFTRGSGRQEVYDGRVLATEGNVIVVTFNYRLNILGFLSSPTEEARGNMGFYDMLEALKWVRENIQGFGGDPDNITIFGQSAGGISSGLMCLSPLTRGMFKRAILESGSPAYNLNDNADKNAQLAQQVAEMVGCAKDNQFLDDPEAVIGCLKSKNASELVEATKKVNKNVFGFSSIIGDEFLPRDPHDQLVSGDFYEVPIMIGNVQDEAAYVLVELNVEHFGPYGKKDRHTNKTLGADTIRRVLTNFPSDEVVQYYLGDVSDTDYIRIREQSYHAIGDYVFVCPAEYFAESYARRGQDVYAYYFNHVSSPGRFYPWADWMGVVHFSEVPFVFGRPLDHPGYTGDEQRLSRRLVKIWSNFAKTGSPGIQWRKFSRNYPFYKVFRTSNRPSYLQNHKKNCEFYRPLFGYP